MLKHSSGFPKKKTKMKQMNIEQLFWNIIYNHLICTPFLCFSERFLFQRDLFALLDVNSDKCIFWKRVNGFLCIIFRYQMFLPCFTPKAPSKLCADDILSCCCCYYYHFSEKISLDISCESSAWQTIHMKCQDLFSLRKMKYMYFKYRLLQLCLRFKGLYDLLSFNVS